MNYKNTLKATEVLESKNLFITGNFPNKTEGLISKFLYTKSFNIDDITKKIDTYINEGDIFVFK